MHQLHRNNTGMSQENEHIGQNLLLAESKTRTIQTYTIVMTMSSFCVGFIVMLSIFLLTVSTTPSSNPNIETIPKNPSDIKITLFGDSLIRRAYAQHNIAGKINSFISGPLSISSFYNQGNF